MDISKMNKADVLRTLYNAAKPQGLGMLSYKPEDMTKDEAEELLKNGTYFDYLYGRVMKVDLSKDDLFLGLYNRDNGYNAGENALSHLIG